MITPPLNDQVLYAQYFSLLTPILLQLDSILEIAANNYLFTLLKYSSIKKLYYYPIYYLCFISDDVNNWARVKENFTNALPLNLSNKYCSNIGVYIISINSIHVCTL